MVDIALFEPEIPPNTGNIIRLCANSGARLHLIHPLGFALDDRAMRRAGLDYHDQAVLIEHRDWDAFSAATRGRRCWAFSTRGSARYDLPRYRDDDLLLFGPETRGLPGSLLDTFPPDARLYLPMLADSRSLNLSNAAAIVLYTAWAQLGFTGAAVR